MSGKIFVLHKNKELTELSQEHYENEDLFQELIENHPAILAGDQINPESPRKWIMVNREMGIPIEQDGGSQFSLDHLFIDQDAIPTFIEVKRSTDTRIRREVVAQMLDYAANAVQYWPIELIRDVYSKNVSESNSLQNIGIENEHEEAFWQAVSVNLRAGKIRLIFAADTIPTTLLSIIEFLNKQMVDTEVLGLEIKQFKSSDGLSTLVPQIVGKTASAAQTKRVNNRQWDEESFIENTINTSGAEVSEICQRLIKIFRADGCRIWWGKGINASFATMLDLSLSHYLFYVYNGDKKTFLQIYFKEMKPALNTPEQKAKLKMALERIPGVHIPEDRLDKYPSFQVNILNDKTSFDLFVEAIRMYIDDIKKSEIN